MSWTYRGRAGGRRRRNYTSKPPSIIRRGFAKGGRNSVVYPQRPIRRTYINSRVQLKKTNAARKKVGLPELDFKRNLKFHDQGWAAYSGTSQWSFDEDLNKLVEGSADDQRVSGRIYFPPQTMRVRITQPQDQEYHYRMLLVKTMYKTDTYPLPLNLLANYNYWQYCTYKDYDQRPAGEAKFKVVKDRRFTWSTYNGNSGTKEIKFKLPGCNVQYDDDDTTGATKTNGLYLLMITDAPSASASHHVQTYFDYKYVDN